MTHHLMHFGLQGFIVFFTFCCLLADCILSVCTPALAASMVLVVILSSVFTVDGGRNLHPEGGSIHLVALEVSAATP
jgi:hypothetical protein